MTTQRHIIIGDIHGCAQELFALLDACGRTPDDEIISVGDLIDRGPDPRAVIELFMTDPNACAILGNHEDKHVRIRTGELRPGSAQIIDRIQLGDFYDTALDWFETLPLSLERSGHFICHAGVIPGTPLDEQPRKALLRAKMPWMKNIWDTSGTPWWDLYEGETPVVYGHSVHAGTPNVTDNTFGIDTGACHGLTLTALILPEQRLVSVDASDDHYRTLKRKYAAELQAAADAPKKPRPPKPPKPGRPVIELDGVRIDGAWLMNHYDRGGGPWIRAIIADIERWVASGEVYGLEALRSRLPDRVD